MRKGKLVLLFTAVLFCMLNGIVCGDLTYTCTDEACSVTGYDGTVPANLEIPAEHDGKPVTSIGKDAFKHAGTLTSVTFTGEPKLETIGEDAFNGTGLTGFTIPASVTSIGPYAFISSAALTSVTFADGSALETIGDYAFCQTALRSAEIPASVTSIGEGSFMNCSELTSVTFAGEPKLLTIGGSAFINSGLTEITIPASVTSIGAGAFMACSDLVSVAFPGNSDSGDLILFLNSASAARQIYACQAVYDKIMSDTNLKTNYGIESPDQLHLLVDLTEADVSVPGSMYNGAVQFPDPVVKIGETPLKKDTDYTAAVYANDGTTAVPEPENAGSYKVKLTGKLNKDRSVSYWGSVTKDWTIAKAVITDNDFTAPTAKTGLSYNGQAQELINAGSSTAGTMVYMLSGTDGSYSAAIPTAVDPGTYTVLYSVEPDGNHLEPRGSLGSVDARILPEKDRFYRLEDWDVFRESRELPATGFAAGVKTPLSLQSVTYGRLNAMLIIPSLNVTAELVTVPAENGVFGVEWLRGRAGIPEGMTLPGEGHSVIMAHNHTDLAEAGPFVNIGSLKENDRVFVDANGEMKSFRVYANELLEADGIDRMIGVAEQEAGSIVLLTCENESLTGGYVNRRAVFAKPN